MTEKEMKRCSQNRGCINQSIPILCVLFTLKLRYPDKVLLLRGYHDHLQMAQCYGFSDECQRVFNLESIFRGFIKTLEMLPPCCIIDNKVRASFASFFFVYFAFLFLLEKYFCVSGGFGPSAITLERISCVNRMKESDLLLELLWSNPEEDQLVDFEPSPKGCGWTWSKKITKQFLEWHGLEFVVRSSKILMDVRTKGSEK
jgi:diadenosine tetraphosphatase ApaH/serine/threonine PP2A family protein phosphatase